MSTSRLTEVFLGALILSPIILWPLQWIRQMAHQQITFRTIYRHLWHILGLSFVFGWFGWPLVLQGALLHGTYNSSGLAFSRGMMFPIISLLVGWAFSNWFLTSFLGIHTALSPNTLPAWIYHDPDMIAFTQESPTENISILIASWSIKIRAMELGVLIGYFALATLILYVIVHAAPVQGEHILSHILLWPIPQ